MNDKDILDLFEKHSIAIGKLLKLVKQHNKLHEDAMNIFKEISKDISKLEVSVEELKARSDTSLFLQDVVDDKDRRE